MSAKSKKLPDTQLTTYIVNGSSIWPEWSDAELNNEKWSEPKNGDDGLFFDTQSVSMPSSLVPYQWIRAKDMPYLHAPLAVCTSSTEVPDLITKNKHLLHSEFARWFISAIMNLAHYGRDGLDVSGENANFVWNGRHQFWQGWMNVYSMNKAGKGAQHRPTINPNGKYVVRLYFMGSWRRIVIDDMMPVNLNGDPLLPRTANDFELWPMLLSKALLKLCSLSCSQHREIVDFHPIACLTGWVSLQLSISHLSPQDKWDLLMKYTQHYEWTSEETEFEHHGLETKMNNEERKSTENLRKLSTPSKLEAVTSFLGLKDMRELTSEVVPGLSPCPSHFIYIAQSRDIPLDPKDAKAPLAKWKLYRWLKWAINQGLIDPTEYFVPIRYLRIVSPFGDCKPSDLLDDSTNEGTSLYTNKLNEQKLNTHKAGQRNKVHNVLTETQRKKSTRDLSADISTWCDFNKLEPYIKDVQLFYKLECFPYTVKVLDTSATEQFPEKPRETKKEPTKQSKKGSKKSSPSEAVPVKEPDFTDTYNWLPKLSPTRNEPLYLLCDSVTSKCFLINFSVFDSPGYTSSSTSSTGSTNDSVANYLVVERHSWFYESSESESLVSLCTAGTKSTIMELEAGRHLLRLYCRAEHRRFVTISSDTIFHLGDRPKMHRLMSTESDRIYRVVKLISDSIVKAFEAFGTTDYPAALKAYYQSYMPDTRDVAKKTEKQLCKKVHGYFIDEMVQLLRVIFPSEEVGSVLRALRIFFFNPDLGLQRFDAMSVMLKSLQQLKDIQLLEARRSTSSNDYTDCSRPAAIVQSFFKMLTIRKYKQIHDSAHREHQEVSEKIRKVAALFHYEKRESLAHQLIRHVTRRHEKLTDMYPFSKDFQYVLRVQECKGTVSNVRPNQWLPIVRLTVNPPQEETAFACIDLFVKLPKYSLRVFNNETGREVVRVVNTVAPCSYRHVRSGYTIFAYGWSEDLRLKELEWTMKLITRRGEAGFHLLDDAEPLPSETEMPGLSVEEFSNTYVPNARACIFRWTVSIAERSFVSCRLSTSYDLAEIQLRVTDEDSNVLYEVQGKSVVMLPVICLQNREISCKASSEGTGEDTDEVEENLTRSKTFYLEAFVLNNSWPLTETEWNVVSEAKTKMASSFAKRKSSAGRTSKSESVKMKKGSKEFVGSNQLLDSPYWTLQVVTDIGSNVEMTEDRSTEKKIALTKAAWRTENPDSLERGKELRMNFLNQHALEPTVASESKSLRGNSSERSITKKASVRGTADESSSAFTQSIETRTLKPPQPRGLRLPPMDLSAYMLEENDLEMRRAKTDYDEEMSISQRGGTVTEANESHKNFFEDMENFLVDHRERYRKMFSRHKDLFWERRARLEDAYEKRKLCIAETKPASAPSIKGSKKKKKV